MARCTARRRSLGRQPSAARPDSHVRQTAQGASHGQSLRSQGETESGASNARAQGRNAQERMFGQARNERKQAIAIGLSEARKAGGKVPRKSSSSRASASRGRKSTAKRKSGRCIRAHANRRGRRFRTAAKAISAARWTTSAGASMSRSRLRDSPARSCRTASTSAFAALRTSLQGQVLVQRIVAGGVGSHSQCSDRSWRRGWLMVPGACPATSPSASGAVFGTRGVAVHDDRNRRPPGGGDSPIPAFNCFCIADPCHAWCRIRISAVRTHQPIHHQLQDAGAWYQYTGVTIITP